MRPSRPLKFIGPVHAVYMADPHARVSRNLDIVTAPKLRSRAIHAATQRVPLPLISAMEPSALCRRMRPAFGPVHAKNSMPSAPTPVERAQSWRVSFASRGPRRPLPSR